MNHIPYWHFLIFGVLGLHGNAAKTSDLKWTMRTCPLYSEFYKREKQIWCQNNSQLRLFTPSETKIKTVEIFIRWLTTICGHVSPSRNPLASCSRLCYGLFWKKRRYSKYSWHTFFKLSLLGQKSVKDLLCTWPQRRTFDFWVTIIENQVKRRTLMRTRCCIWTEFSWVHEL